MKLRPDYIRKRNYYIKMKIVTKYLWVGFVAGVYVFVFIKTVKNQLVLNFSFHGGNIVRIYLLAIVSALRSSTFFSGFQFFIKPKRKRKNDMKRKKKKKTKKKKNNRRLISCMKFISKRTNNYKKVMVLFYYICHITVLFKTIQFSQQT